MRPATPYSLLSIGAGLLACGLAAGAEPPAAPLDAAARFGALPRMVDPELSPDGNRVAYVVPGPGLGSTVYVADFDSGHSHGVISSDGKPLRITGCGWSGPERLVCYEYGLMSVPDHRAAYSSFTRLFAADLSGGNVQMLGQPDNRYQLDARQYDGYVVDWLGGTDDTVLMARTYVPESATGRHIASTAEGLGVDRVDTRTLKSTPVEAPRRTATRYFSDGAGNIRLMALASTSGMGERKGAEIYYFRTKDQRDWQPLGEGTIDGEFEPLAVDGAEDFAYVLRKRDGRKALYRIRLDGSMRQQLVLERPDVDISGVVTVGRHHHVIGAEWAESTGRVEYFDPAYRSMAEQLGRALPRLPLINFVSASADEQVLLVRADSDLDPGRFFRYDRRTHQLDEVAAARPPLEHMPMGEMRPVSYAAADGTSIPAYLTLPPGVTDPKGLPAVVMPHGGPASRDTWGFDWLAQFFAHQGYVVLQPNYRGSTGYGDAWFVHNGFRSWRLAIDDVADGGRWLVAQGIADPAHLAIVGWSYGGYAALQSQVVAPGLFKASVAIAPVTDFGALKSEARDYSNSTLVEDYVGSGPHIEEGSPRRHVAAFTAPVLMFHGEMDINVSPDQSQAMDAALRKAGKKSTLVTYPGLDHQLGEGGARADMLRRADAFLRASLGLPAPN